MAEPRQPILMTPWDWHALPVVNGDMSSGRSFEIEQSSGRKIWLRRLHQYGTDAGRMAGIPQASDRYIQAALEMAANYCGNAEKPPVVLRPRLIQTAVHTHPAFQDSLNQELPRAKLPGITCIGEFGSDTVHNSHALMSFAVVIWYQEGFGLPDDDHILAQLRDLDWAAHAWDWFF